MNDERDDLIKYLKTKGIDTGIHWQPGHKFSLLSDTKRGDLSITEEISQQIISLPLHSGMSVNDLDHIIESIKSFKC